MKVAIITGSRADWNGLGKVAKCLRDHYKADVRVIAIGQHADIAFGEQSITTIINDGFDPQVIRTNVREDMALGCGSAAIAIGSALDSHAPDMAVVLGDRFEILGAASAAALRRIPLAHIGGGDITEGSIDNKLRYAITALADYHFVTNEDSELRLANGILRGYPLLYCSGNPALDRIAETPILPRAELFKKIGLTENKRNILVCYHSVTVEQDNGVGGCIAMFEALDKIDDASWLVLGTNSDAGASAINTQLYDFTTSEPEKRALRDNLSPELFYSVLTHFDCMVGNSSAGLVETAGFGIPVVNIGDRQKGRPYPANVFNCAPTTVSISGTLETALAMRCPPSVNPYGDGHSAPRIAKIMVEQMHVRKS